jgi:hypothetical protein
VSPKTGPRTAREAAWLKRSPTAMADGLTGGRSVMECQCGSWVEGREREFSNVQLRDMVIVVVKG